MWVAAVHSLTGFAKPSNLKDSYYFPKAWHSECSCPDFHYFHFWWLKASVCVLQRFHSNQTFFNFTQLLFALAAKERHKYFTFQSSCFYISKYISIYITCISKSHYFLFIHDNIHKTHLLKSLRKFPSSFRKILFGLTHSLVFSHDRYRQPISWSLDKVLL